MKIGKIKSFTDLLISSTTATGIVLTVIWFFLEKKNVSQTILWSSKPLPCQIYNFGNVLALLRGCLVRWNPTELDGIGMVNSVDRIPLGCLVANGMELNSMNSLI